jgi:hypothetical protein
VVINFNGDHSQWSQGTNFPVCADKQMGPDGTRYYNGSGAVHTFKQQTVDVPTLNYCKRVIPATIEVSVTTADATVGATEYTYLAYRGEGSELAELLGGDGDIEVQSYFQSSLPGTYHLGMANGPETLYSAQPFFIPAANTWTPVSITFPRPDGVIGTDWWTDSRVGYSVFLVLAAGSSLQEDAGPRWQTGLKLGCNSQVNFNATVGNKIRWGGLDVRRARNPYMAAFQPPEITEQAALRYIVKSFARGVAPASAVGYNTGETTFPATIAGAQIQIGATVRYPVPLRKSVTPVGYNPVNAGAQAKAKTHGDCTATTFDNKTESGFRIITTAPAATTVGEEIGLHWMADASLPAIGTNIGG